MEASIQTSAYQMHTSEPNHQDMAATPNHIKVTRISYHQTGSLQIEKRRIPQFDESKSSGVSKANWQLALKNTQKKSNRYYKGQQMGLCTDVQHFKIYGPGVSLFFQFQNYLIITFSIMSVVALSPCIYNFTAGTVMNTQLTSLSYYFASTTIANFDSTSADYKPMFKYVNMITGMANVLIFIVFYFFWLRKGTTLNEQIRNKIKLRSYYVLELTQFAVGATEQDVQKFMSQFGNVVQVAAVKNYDETISLSKRIYELQLQLKKIQLKRQSERSNQYDLQIKQKQQNIDEIYKQLVLYEDDIKEQVVKFFITFSNIEEREKAIKELEKHRKRFIDCCYNETPQNFYLKGQKIYVQPCHNEPTQIIWQNQHVNWSTRWVRVLIQYILLLAAVTVGFLLVSFVNILAPSSTSTVDTSQYTSSTILAVTNTTIVQSWCISNKFSVLQTSSSSAIYTFCWSYIISYFLKILISLGISVSVFVVKFVMKQFVIFLARFKRYKTQSEQSKDMVQNLFLVYTATTVLITFFLQARVFGISFKRLISNFIKNEYLQTNLNSLQQYSDFASNWYLEIGYQIAFNCIIMILHPALTMPLVLYVSEKISYWKAESQQVQANMQKRIEPKQFQIESNYAQMLVIIFVGLSFSGGMPIIIIICFLALTTKFFYMRYIFYRYCKIPKTFDEALDNQIVKLLPFAVMIHFCFSIWMFGVTSIFKPEKPLDINLGTSSFMMSLGFLFERLFATWYYSAFFALFLVIWVFKTFFYNFLIKIIIGNKDDSKLVPVAINANEFSQQMNPISILSNKTLCQSYKIENNPDYVEVLQIMRKKRKFIIKIKSDTPEQEVL